VGNAFAFVLMWDTWPAVVLDLAALSCSESLKANFTCSNAATCSYVGH
jgi:hypothetical protein